MPEIAQTADHALRILEELGRGQALAPSQLSERLGLNRTVVHRLLVTLNARGFVLRQGSVYRPGATLIRLASVLEPDLRASAAPVMAQVAEETGESLVLHVPDGMDAVVLDQAVASKHVLQVSHQIGSRHSLASGASGRALLAFLPPAAIRRVVESLPHEPSIERKLEAVRQMRYAVSHDELQTGVHGVAVPVLNADGTAIASLAMLVPDGRARGLEDHVDALWEASEQITRAADPFRSGDVSA